MLNNHLRGDKKTEDHKNHDKVHENAGQNQNRLEELISSGKKYLSKTGKTLAFTGALTATTFIPGLINKALAETVYKNNFEIPVYSEQYNPATKGIARDKENVLLKVEKDKDINELEITLKLEDFDKARENPSTGTFLNESFSTPVFVHSSNIDISEIRQKAYVNKGDDSYWTKLIPPEENKKLQRGIKLEKKILSKALKLGGFKLNDELKEHLERWWERFVEEQREKQRKGFLKKAGEQEYKVTKISPFTHDKTSGRSMETARKFNISFEQEIPDKEELYMFQGIRLEKTIPTRASGSLKERLVIPFSIGEFSLWSLQEGEDFEWLQRGNYEQLRTSKKATDNHEVISMLNYWDSGNEKIFSFMRPVKKLDFDAKILIREDNKRPELIDRAKLYLPGITQIGDNSLNRTMLPLCEKDMDQENIDDPEWFIGVKLGEGKNEYKGKYIGEVSLDNSYKELKDLEDSGEIKVYTLKKGGELKPAEQTEWKKENGIHSMRFSSKNRYSNLEKFGFGIFLEKNNDIKGMPFFYTDTLEKEIYKQELHKNTEIRKLKIIREHGIEGNIIKAVCKPLD